MLLLWSVQVSEVHFQPSPKKRHCGQCGHNSFFKDKSIIEAIKQLKSVYALLILKLEFEEFSQLSLIQRWCSVLHLFLNTKTDIVLKASVFHVCAEFL